MESPSPVSDQLAISDIAIDESLPSFTVLPHCAGAGTRCATHRGRCSDGHLTFAA